MPHTRLSLLFGPYKPPRCKVGQWRICHVKGRVRVEGFTDAPTHWPYTYRHASDRRPSIIVCGDLVRAIRTESVIAVAYQWGVTPQTVTKWRRAIGVDRQTAGTVDLQRRTIGQHFDDEARAKAIASTQRPERNAKVAAAKRGKPRPAGIMEALHKGNVGRKHTLEAKRRMSEANKRRGAWPPAAGVPWSAAEDAKLGTMPDAEVARQTGRTLSAVHNRRRVLGVGKYRG